MVTRILWWRYPQIFRRIRHRESLVPSLTHVPRSPRCQDTVDQIKLLMTEASRELLTASRHRAFFRQVKILLPRTWTSVSYDQTLQGETFMDAEIRVDR